MSRFYGSVKGERGTATRCGARNIEAHIRGWKEGVRVTGFVNELGEDEFRVEMTGGSDDPSAKFRMTVVDQFGQSTVVLVSGIVKITQV